MRWIEVLLLMVPVGLFVAWRQALRRGEHGPSRRLLAGTALGLAAFAAGMLWYASHDRLPPDSVYVPAQVKDGVLVPGHAR